MFDDCIAENWKTHKHHTSQAYKRSTLSALGEVSSLDNNHKVAEPRLKSEIKTTHRTALICVLNEMKCTLTWQENKRQ